MTIKKEGYRTKEFCKEYIEIEQNKNSIIKTPRYPLSKTNRIAVMLVYAIGFLGIIIIDILINKTYQRDILLLLLFYPVTILTLKYYCDKRKRLKSLISEEQNTTIEFDKNGISINKNDIITYFLPWESIILIKSFEKSIAFFNQEMVLILEIEDKEAILNYMKENEIVKRIYEKKGFEQS